MDSQKNHSGIQTCGSYAISCLADSHDGCCYVSKIVGYGGIETLISSMTENMLHSDVLVQACCALFKIAFHSSWGEIRAKGGIDAILNAAKGHLDDSDVQEWCCRAVRNLACDIENMTAIQEKGGIDAIVNGANAQPDDVDVHKWCCYALCHLSHEKDSITAIRD
jgi:hypothetical protein